MIGNSDDETNFPYKLLKIYTKKYIKKLGSGSKTLIISNDEIEDIMKIVKSLEDSGFLLKGLSETIQNEAKEQGGFLSMLLGTFGACLLGNMLTGKGTNRAEEGIIRAGRGSKISLKIKKF